MIARFGPVKTSCQHLSEIRDAHLRFGGGTKCPDLVNHMVVRVEKAAPAVHERDMLERLCAMGDVLDENAAASLVSNIRELT